MCFVFIYVVHTEKYTELEGFNHQLVEGERRRRLESGLVTQRFSGLVDALVLTSSGRAVAVGFGLLAGRER